MGSSFIRDVGPIRVWRCTEAVDPKSGYSFRTIGNPDGRCIEIASPAHQLLMDRRLARQVAEAILDICGPTEEQPADVATADMVQVDYDALGVIVGFSPYVPDSGSLAEDRRAFVAKVRADKGLPPSNLFDLPGASHG